MRDVGVSRRLAVGQRLSLYAVGGLAAALSLWFTWRFCVRLWPHEREAVCALGILFEAAKLVLGPIGLRGVAVGSWQRRVAFAPLVLLTAALMVGSVLASSAHTRQTEVLAQADTAASRARIQEMRRYDQQIDILISVQEAQARDGQRTKALQTGQAIDALRSSRTALGVGSGTQAAADIPAVVHVVVALVVELISVAVALLLHASRTDIGIVECALRGGRRSRARDTATERAVPATVIDLVGVRYETGYRQLRQAIQRGEVEPTVQAARALGAVSQGPAQRMLQALCQEGVIASVGRGRYRRVSKKRDHELGRLEAA
jgi:hypothetical protein